MERQDTAVHKNSLKFSVVKPNLVIYKKEGNRKKRKDAWLHLHVRAAWVRRMRFIKAHCSAD